MTARFTAILAFAILALGPSARLFAHQGHEHKVMGTVTMAAADHVMLKDKDGNEVTIKVTKEARVKAKPMIKVEEIKTGLATAVTDPSRFRRPSTRIIVHRTAVRTDAHRHAVVFLSYSFSYST